MFKRIFIFILIAILLVNTISAFDFDNLKRKALDKEDFEIDNLKIPYNKIWEKYKPIEIKNAFGLGKTLFKGAIVNHTEICSKDCSSVITLKHSGGVLIEELIFKENQPKEYSIKVNGENYLIGEEKEEGIYNLSIEGKKSIFDNVDWVIRNNGRYINEWAIWGSEANVTLNSPANASNYTSNLIPFNCSANVIGDDFLENMSLWDNSTGIWKLNNTISLIGSSTEQNHGAGSWSLDSSTALQGGGKITTGSERLILESIKKTSDSTATRALILNSGKGVLTTASFSGNIADMGNYTLQPSTTYYVSSDNSGSSYLLYRQANTFPISNSFIDWVGGLRGSSDDASFIYNIESINVKEITSDTTKILNNTINSSSLIWNCQACDSDGDCGFAAENYSLFRDKTIPIINIESPSIIENSGEVGGNLILNVTFNDTNLDSCWYNYNGTNITIEGCLNGIKNSTNFVLENFGTVQNMTIYANDSVGNFNSTFFEWTIKVLEINTTYNTETIEGNVEEFLTIIQLASGFTISETVLMNYNGSLEMGQNFDEGDLTILRKNDLIIPSVSADTNLTWFWNVTLSDSTNLNLSLKNQTVFNIGIDDCSTNTNLILNFTVLDEEEQTKLNNVTAEIAVNIYDRDRNAVVIDYSNKTINENPLQICLSINLTNGSSYSLDTIVKYEEEDHAVEYYNIVNQTLNNETTTSNINLFDLHLNESTEFQITFTGDDFLPVEDSLVFINRQYIEENVFKTVELPKTDANGQTVVHLVRNDIVYNILFLKNGEIIGNFNNVRAFCDDLIIGDCKIALNAIDESSSIFNYDEEVGILFESPPSYNDSNKLITFGFVSVDNDAKNVTMHVQIRDVFGNTTICTNTVISISGTLSCNVSDYSTFQNLYVDILVDETLWLPSIVKISNEAYGSIGYVAWFFLSLVLVLSLGDSKNGVLISMAIGYIGALSLGWILGSLIGVGSAGIWIIVITFLGLWKINKQRRN